MGYEVDFLPVGEGERSGDAICVRFGDLLGGDRNRQFVMVIDGGTSVAGKAAVKHINEFYFTNTVDLVVSTHPDNDHVSGLREIVEQTHVRQLWMHRPWLRAGELLPLFERSSLRTANGLKRQIREALCTATDVEAIAVRKGIPILEPFAGKMLRAAGGTIQVLGPSESYYDELLPQFRDTPEPASSYTSSRLFGGVGTAIMEVAAKVAAPVMRFLDEKWDLETLGEPGENDTSAENNSGAILTIEVDGRRLLFTGDAGVPALTRATEFAEMSGIRLPSCSFVQVPHHGSRRNVGPKLLDRMLGPKGQPQCRLAYVSCAPESEKHPSRRVTNAFQRRGAQGTVAVTKGKIICARFDSPPRSGWVSVDCLPFFTEVEE